MSVFHVGMIAGGCIGLCVGVIVMGLLAAYVIESVREDILKELKR